jgi:quercetin dioxygenase-like cupin family protein
MVIKSLASTPAEQINETGVLGVTRQILLGPQDGAPNFTMRCFTVAPGGYTYYHAHDYEHEIFIVSGTGIARGKNREVQIKSNEAILVPPNEIHQILNPHPEPLVFLCLIPNQ